MKKKLKELGKFKTLTMLLPGILVVALVVGILQAGLPEAMVKSNNEITPQQVATKGITKKKKPSASAAAVKSGGGKTGGPSGGDFHHDGSLDGQKFKDGSYEGSAQGFKGTVTSRVTIAKGKISRINVISNVDDAPYFNKALAVVGKILKKQSTNVDTVSGATYSSRGIIGSVENALKKAVIKDGKKSKKTKNPHRNSHGKKPKAPKQPKPEPEEPPAPPLPEGEFNDGVYSGWSKRSYSKSMTGEVTVEDGQITNISITSNDTPSFLNRAKAIIPIIISQQTPEGVDAITDATMSCNGIVDCVRRALHQALKK